MKKLIALIITAAILACVGYYFFANNMMMIHTISEKKEKLLVISNKAYAKIADQDEYAFTYTETSIEGGVDRVKFTSTVTIKLSATAKVLKAEIVDKTTDTAVERTIQYQTNEGVTDAGVIYTKEGDTKTKSADTATFEEALAAALNNGGDVVAINEIFDYDNAGKKTQEQFDTNYKKTTMKFSFKPFYIGSKLNWEATDESEPAIITSTSKDITLSGKLKRISVKVGESSNDCVQRTVLFTGSSVTLNKLTAEQIAQYV